MEEESLRSNSPLVKWTNGDEKEFLLRSTEEKRWLLKHSRIKLKPIATWRFHVVPAVRSVGFFCLRFPFIYLERDTAVIINQR